MKALLGLGPFLRSCHNVTAKMVNAGALDENRTPDSSLPKNALAPEKQQRVSSAAGDRIFHKTGALNENRTRDLFFTKEVLCR